MSELLCTIVVVAYVVAVVVELYADIHKLSPFMIRKPLRAHALECFVIQLLRAHALEC